jgi:CHAT domain-containing protein
MAGVVVQSAGAGQETPRQRQLLRDAQAYEIRASALMALHQPAAARADVDHALSLLREPLGAFAGPNVTLSDVDPLLAVAVRGDDLTLSPGPATLKSYRLAVSAYGLRHPDDLPMGFFLIQLAQAEAAASAQDKAMEERALADYEDAFRIFLAQRGSLEASADLVKTYFDILLARIGDQPAAHPAEVARFFRQSQILISQSSAKAALRQAERIKSGDAVEAGLAHQYDEVAREIRRIQDEEDYDDASGRLTPAVRASYDDQLKTLRARQETLDGRLAAVDPGYKARLASTVGLNELQAVLTPGKEVYVRAFVLGAGGYGLLVSHDAAIPYRIDLDARRAAALVDAVRRPVDQLETVPGGGKSPRIFDVAAAHRAFETVLGPVQAQVLGAQLLIFDPDAILVALPLPALVTDADSVETMKANVAKAKADSRPVSYAGISWLGRRVATSVSLSPAAFIALRAEKPSSASKPFLGLGDPVLASGDPRAYGSIRYRGPASAAGEAKCKSDRAAVLEPLPASGELVADLAARAGGDSATVVGPAFTDTYVEQAGAEGGALGQYRVVFFATHGLLPSDVDQCSPPALVTSLDPAPASVALLDAPHIEGLRLQADLVVLAACNTGRNTDKGSGGEALGGLVESFVEAGAHNVLVSNWSVGSNATKLLMERMFAHAKDGVSQAEALALAERDLMNETVGRQNPYWWAAFMIVGDGAKPLTL